jgi:PilZ domain-containing protein
MGRQETGPEDRRETQPHQRRELQAEVTIHSESGSVSGRSLDISESGMAAILPVELPTGKAVELEIKLLTASAVARAIVRNRSVLRHGFEFVQPLHNIVQHQTAPDACQSCDTAGFILQALVGDEGVVFAHVRCPECGGTGHNKAE